MPVAGADDDVGADFLYIFRMELRETAHDRDHAILVSSRRPPNHLPGFRVGCRGDRAGVDDADIRGFVEGHQPEPGIQKLIDDGYGFIFIDFATQ